LDLPKAFESTTNWKSGDILSTLELLKSGLITSAMHGRSRELMIDPPAIIIFSNSILPLDQLSADRWHIFEMDQKSIDPDIKRKNLKMAKTLIRGKKF
jgi:hypothetical protein